MTRIANSIAHWNHSKIVASDGKRIVFGGVNFYAMTYLNPAPVLDNSLQVYGPAIAR